MTTLELRFYCDQLQPGAEILRPLKAAHRIVYVYDGSATLLQDNSLEKDTGFYSKSAMSLSAGPKGAEVWRWEIALEDTEESLAEGDGVISNLLLSGVIKTVETEDNEGWLMRLDSVAFPAGGCAYTHTHQGPGIRSLVSGSIRIDAENTSHTYGIGEPWFESGPDPVFAQAGNLPTRFVRTSVLPERLLGKSSIRYENPEDLDKPKDQNYRSYVDVVIGRPNR